MTQDREKPFERLLEQSLRAREREAIDCPDVEILGAYFEQNLDVAERASLETHLSTCPRCRAVVFDLARLGEPPPLRPSPGFWPRWTPAFGALATAAVAVVLAIRFFPETQETRVAEAPPPAAHSSRMTESSRLGEDRDDAPASRAKPTAAAGAKQEFRAEAEKKKAQSEVAAAKAVKPAPPPDRKDFRDEEADLRAGARRQERGKAAELKREPEAEQPAIALDALEGRVGATAAATPPPAASQAAADNERANVAAPSAPSDAAKEDAFANLQKTRDQATGAAGGAAAMSRAPLRERAASLDGQDKAAPAFLWRLGMDGVERSEDGGATWAIVSLPTNAKIVAVSSPKPPVAWAAGERGVVLRTLDGRTWQRVPAPTDEDLVSIFAKSPDSATVTTRSGRTFETQQSGATWKTR